MQTTAINMGRLAATWSFAPASSVAGSSRSIHSWRMRYGTTHTYRASSILYTPRAPLSPSPGAGWFAESAAQRRWASSKSPPNPHPPYPRFTPPPTSANSPQRSSLGRSKLDAAIENSARIAPYGAPPGISAESWANRHRSASSSSKIPASPSDGNGDPSPQPSENDRPATPVSPPVPSPVKDDKAKVEEKLKPLLDPRGHAQDYVPFIQRLIRRTRLQAPNALHRPSKDELLAAASGWWERLRIRLKWFTIRGWRRFNTDDLSAFASWFVVGNTLWILIGTTTFVSAVFATLNSLSLQEYVARWISDYMTSETGVTVIFESAIVPKWGASTITFRNVFISRRPRDSSDTPLKSATAKPPSPVPFVSSNISPETYLVVPPASEAENYTMFDVNLEEVEVTLSFMRWLDGKGLVKDAKVKGVRGVIDRRSVWWDMSKPLVPADYRHPTRTGDFELDSFHVEDALVTVYQPGGQKPYNLSIFNAAIGPLRKRWLFYDVLNAEGITGQMDNCLFSLHMPQKLGKANGESKRDDSAVKRMARFRIDGLPIEHAQYATGHTAPMSWITSGRVDAVLDIKFPFHPDEQVDIKAIFEEISRNVVTIAQGSHPDDASHHSHRAHDAIAAGLAADQLNPGQARLARPPLRAPINGDRDLGSSEQLAGRKVIVDIDLRFRDLKAAVPVFTSDLSVRNNAIIRPIVAFINANRTLVPIHCQVAADLSDFDGSWTLFETGLTTSISDQIYDALAYHVSSEAANSKRIRQVSFWGIQRGAEVLLDTLRTVVDPMHSQLMAAA